MINWEAAKRDELQAMFPDYDVWYVPRYLNTALWCARPKGAAVATHNCESARALQAALTRDLEGPPPNVIPIMRKYGA